MAHLTAWCEQRGIPYQGVPVGTIKRSATGKGNADKAAMLAAVAARGFPVSDDNEADALALLLCVKGASAMTGTGETIVHGALAGRASNHHEGA